MLGDKDFSDSIKADNFLIESAFAHLLAYDTINIASTINP